jgi:glycine oxidase
MITIIGGGVFGLTIGWYLARKGQRVTILERNNVGRGATWVAAGMLMPWKLSNSFSMELFNLQRESHTLWPEFAQELQNSSGVDIYYQTEGRYFVALDEKAVKRFKKQFAFHQEIGFPLEWLSGNEVRQREPNLGPNVMAAIFSPLGHMVDNRQLVKALKTVFLRCGGVLHEQACVLEILIEAGQVCGVRLGTEILSTDTVILAAGANSGQIKGVPRHLRTLIQPLKGQTLALQMPTGRPFIKHPIIGPVYFVPRPKNRRLLVGTTVEEEAGFDIQPTVAGVYFMLKKAQAVIPSIKNLSVVEMGAGSRPTGFNRLPVLGPTAVQGLIMATGGHSYGILLSPIVAQAITHFILTGKIPNNIQGFTPHLLKTHPE